ncbi:erythromycin esterase family protein [Streptosporangium sp. NPDC001681]|uniref:erythromycin esterase family protein n=1 Tax=Streptosporangium sp. NPDC001681 TaxID=3154395 RepID=UPI0033238EAA
MDQLAHWPRWIPRPPSTIWGRYGTWPPGPPSWLWALRRTINSPGHLGGHLRARFGPGYLSIGPTFTCGALPQSVPSPPADFAETPLNAAGLDAFLLDLRTSGPEPVRAWLQAPARTRLIGLAQDPAEHPSGGTFGGWFDLVAHHRRVTPVHLISI